MVQELEMYRDEFGPTGRLAYLNHAGVAPLPRRVARAMGGVIDECAQWGAFNYSSLWGVVERTRGRGAELLRTSPERVAFVKNTSAGVSFVAQGFDWREGDAVVVPEGEFPSNIYPWLNLEKRGVRVVRVPMRGGQLLLEDFESALATPGVRMLAVSSVEYGNGFVNDLATLGRLCRERGIFFFVDAIQSLGWQELYPEELGIDALAADAHKWLLGPEGCGLFYLSQRGLDEIAPLELGWNSVVDPFDFAREHFDLKPGAARFEAGSYSLVLVRGVEAALELLLEVGLETITKRSVELAERAASGLSALEGTGVRLLSPYDKGLASPIVTFSPGGHDPMQFERRLAERDIFVAARGGGVRVSPHFYNNEEDVDRLLTAVEGLL